MARAEPPGPLIGAGRAADVYDIGGGRVLRRYRVPFDVEPEAAVMRTSARPASRSPGSATPTAPTWSWSAWTGATCWPS
jgi:hypothetical protein